LPHGDRSARERVLAAAMDLFGRQGFRATTVAQIEQAAGLSPGAGGLYRHFPSKRDLLETGLRAQVAAGAALRELLAETPPMAGSGPKDQREQLLTVARAGLARLQEEPDLNRLLLRDLAQFPDLLALVRDSELRAVHNGLTAWLRMQRNVGQVDVEGLAAVLMGAVSHYWVMSDVFSGSHPLGVDQDRYVEVLADMVVALLESQ
jgi:AcrR family transcriptional regulator